jgi:hypothetical protein
LPQPSATTIARPRIHRTGLGYHDPSRVEYDGSMARPWLVLAMCLLASSPAAAERVPSPPRRCVRFGAYASAGVWGGAKLAPKLDGAAGIELATGARYRTCDEAERPQLELRLGPFYRYLDREDLGGNVLGGESEASWPLAWNDLRLGAHVQLGIAAAAHSHALLYSAAGARLRRDNLWVGLDVTYAGGDHLDATSVMFVHRNGIGALVGAGFEGKGAAVLVGIGAIVGGFLLFVAATSE